MNETTTNWIVRNFKELVGLFDSKPRAFATVGMIFIIVFLALDLRRMYNKRAIDSEARLKRSEDFIYRQLERRFAPEINQMRENTDSARAKVDSTVSKMQPLLERVSEAVDEVNKKRR